MRWKSWYPADVGDMRVKTWFALFPVKISNDCRWLERVTVEFELKSDCYRRSEPRYYWNKVRFVDDIHMGVDDVAS